MIACGGRFAGATAPAPATLGKRTVIVQKHCNPLAIHSLQEGIEVLQDARVFGLQQQQ
jgi:hypothetical protein